MVVILMIVVGGILFYISERKSSKSFSDLSAILIIVAMIIEVFGAIPDEGYRSQYKDWKLKKETELVSLSNRQSAKGGGAIFVSITTENVYTYRYEIDSKFGTETSKEYVVDTVSGFVEEVEDIKCEMPLLMEYKSKFRVGFWRIAFPGEATQYIFYVPEGTIQKEISLK